MEGRGTAVSYSPMTKRSTDDPLAPFRRRLAEESAIALAVRARPGAARTEVTGVLADGSVKVSLRAPAEDGKANEVLVAYLAEAFGVARAAVRIVAGHAAKRKLVRLEAR